MLVKGVGNRRVVVYAEGTRFSVGVDLAEVVKFLENLWPWELGHHVRVSGNTLIFEDRIPFERVLVYLLARRGGLTHEEAVKLATSTRQFELSLLAGAFLYRFWVCRINLRRCRYIVDVFAKIVASYKKVVENGITN